MYSIAMEKRVMKEETTHYAKELFEKTAERLGTERFFTAGGCLRDFVENGSRCPKDIDCFFGNRPEMTKAYLSLMKQGYMVAKERNNSYVMEKEGHPTYDLVILPIVINGSHVWKEFDFTNCCVAYGHDGLTYSSTFFKDIKEKKLRMNYSKLPYHSISRAGKFIKKGYVASDELKLTLFNNAVLCPWGPYDEEEYNTVQEAGAEARAENKEFDF